MTMPEPPDASLADDSADTVDVISLPNTLKWKVTGGDLEKPLRLDHEAMKRAEAAIAELAGDFVARARDDLARIEALFGEAAAPPGPALAKLAEIGGIALEIAGQGGTFGYPLLSAIGDSLYKLIKRLDASGARELEIVRLHLDAMGAVLREELKGSGGRKGVELQMLLRRAAASV